MIVLRRATFVVVAVASVTACADLLGGLEEGRPRPSERIGVDASPVAPEAGSDASDAGACDARPWLDGFAHRVFVDVAMHAAITEYTFALRLDTRSLVAAGRLREDGRDLRATAADGTTVLPLRLGSPIGDATKIWVKTDLAEGVNRIFLYYGDPDAGPSRDDVFFDGIVANPRFDPDAGGWSDRYGAGELALRDGEAIVVYERAGSEPEFLPRAGWCQSFVFPFGRAWSIVFDVRPIVVGTATVEAWLQDGPRLWETSSIQPIDDATSRTIQPGARVVCLGVWLPSPDVPVRVGAAFSNVRANPFAYSPPQLSEPSLEESPCP
ncbi:MAG: hypothetical protein KIT84_22355 [Labilithrix sp.]|nr:hypothetical protein [Labilithrix sp.]